MRHLLLLIVLIRVSVGSAYVYVGASDIAEEGVFIWDNGDLVKNIPWDATQPNEGTSGNCVMMHSNWDFHFGDVQCSIKLEELCQIDIY